MQTRHDEGQALVLECEFRPVRRAIRATELEDDFGVSSELSLDTHTIQGTAHSADLDPTFVCCGRVEVFYDETFQAPVPYLTLWDKLNGSSVDCKLLKGILPLVDPVLDSTTTAVEQKLDHTKYEYGMWMVGVHPLSWSPVLTQHVCDAALLYETMSTIEGDAAASPFLWWISKLLSSLSKPMPPRLFQLLQAELRRIKR